MFPQKQLAKLKTNPILTNNIMGLELHKYAISKYKLFIFSI